MNGWYSILIVAAFCAMLEIKNRQIIDLLKQQIKGETQKENRAVRREPSRYRTTAQREKSQFRFTEEDFKQLKETGHASGRWSGGEQHAGD